MNCIRSVRPSNPGTVNEKAALNHLSLTLEEGDFVTVIGGNGAGKSTMLNAISGVWPVDEGTIRIDGVDVTELSEHRRAVYLGRVFQDPMVGTAGNMTIEENLALAARRGEKRTLPLGHQEKRAGAVQRAAPPPGTGAGGPAHRQGGAAFRRTAAGPDLAHGLPEKAQGPPSG